MISLEKLKVLAPLQKLPKSVADLGKIMLPKALKSCPESNKSSKSGHTAPNSSSFFLRMSTTRSTRSGTHSFYLPMHATHAYPSIY